MKTGIGTLSLKETNTYTGDTVVNQGTLSVTQASFADNADVAIHTGTILNLSTESTDTIRAFYINGVAQAAGTWGAEDSEAEHASPLITGTGLLNVTAGPTTGFDTWVASSGLTDADAAFGADPDHDGIPNGIEFVLGGEANPANAGSNSTALLPVPEATGDNFVVTYHRRHESAYLDPHLEISTSFTSWDRVSDPGNATITVTPGESSDEVTAVIPKGGRTQLFVRLKAGQAD